MASLFCSRIFHFFSPHQTYFIHSSRLTQSPATQLESLVTNSIKTIINVTNVVQYIRTYIHTYIHNTTLKNSKTV